MIRRSKLMLLAALVAFGLAMAPALYDQISTAQAQTLKKKKKKKKIKVPKPPKCTCSCASGSTCMLAGKEVSCTAYKTDPKYCPGGGGDKNPKKL